MAQKQEEREKAVKAIKTIKGRLSDLNQSLDHGKKVDEIPVKESSRLLGAQSVKLEREDFER